MAASSSGESIDDPRRARPSDALVSPITRRAIPLVTLRRRQLDARRQCSRVRRRPRLLTTVAHPILLPLLGIEVGDVDTTQDVRPSKNSGSGPANAKPHVGPQRCPLHGPAVSGDVDDKVLA